MLHMPVDVRNLSLALLALFASVALLHWASAVFIPIMLSLLLTTALRPWWTVLYRYHVPRWLSAGAPLISSGAGAGQRRVVAERRRHPTGGLARGAKKVRDNLTARAGGSSPLDTVQKAATQIEQAATENSTTSPPWRGVQRVVVERPPFNVRDYLWAAPGLICALGQLRWCFSRFCTGLRVTCFATSCCALQAPAWSAADHHPCWRHYQPDSALPHWCRSSREVCWWAWPTDTSLKTGLGLENAAVSGVLWLGCSTWRHTVALRW